MLNHMPSMYIMTDQHNTKYSGVVCGAYGLGIQEDLFENVLHSSQQRER